MEETKQTDPSGGHSKKVRISRATLDDVKEITELINKEHERSGALLRVGEDEVAGWVGLNLSFVARRDGRIIGHSAVTVWPKSGWLEFRGQVVQPAYRGEGIYNHMTRRQIREIFRSGRGRTIVAVKNKVAKGTSLLETIGFKLVGDGITTELVKQGIPEEFFYIGPQNKELRVWTLVWENYASASRRRALAKADRTAKAQKHRKQME
jgi:N-acetylglutamate synthase-like GNAT family acetyltransferase